MYSVVMATLLVAGAGTPDFHRGCSGCYSSCYSGCGGARHGGGGLFHHGRGHGCHGCSSYGCYGGCYSSCYGGCYSSYCSGGCYSSCYGGCYSSGYSGCYSSGYSGCYASCYGGCTVSYGGCCSTSIGYTTGPRVIEVPSKKSEPIDAPKKTGTENGGSTVRTKSRIIVSAPENARVWVDNVECPVRSFDTPALNANQQYVYNFRMETVRDGQTVVQTQRAIITPGQPVNVDFRDGGTATVSAR